MSEITSRNIRELEVKFVPNEYISIPLDSLRADAKLDRQFYLKVRDKKYVKYREPGLKFTKNVRDRLRENKHTHIFINPADTTSLHRYLETNLRQTLADESLEPLQKMECLYETTAYMVRTMMVEPCSSEAVQAAQSVVNTAVGVIVSDPKSWISGFNAEWRGLRVCPRSSFTSP